MKNTKGAPEGAPLETQCKDSDFLNNVLLAIFSVVFTVLFFLLAVSFIASVDLIITSL